MYAFKLSWNIRSWYALVDLIFCRQSRNLHVRSQNGPNKPSAPFISYIHFTSEYKELFVKKHSIIVEIGTVSRLWLCGRSWRLEIDFRWNSVNIWKSRICSNKLDVQETNISFTQFIGSWFFFAWYRFPHGRQSRAWFLGFDRWCTAFKREEEIET